MLDNLIPIAQKHSLRQVVANIFLLQPVVEHSRYKELLPKFKNQYQKFELLNTNTVNFRFSNEVVNPENQSSVISGYRFVGFEEGRLSRILKEQNTNNDNQAKGVISYFSLNYPNWGVFKKDFFKDLILLSSLDNSYFNAISLNFLNEFEWKSNKDIPIDKIFNNNAEFLSDKFFKSQNSSFLINTENYSENKQVIEKLEIVVSKNNRKIITSSELAFKFGSNFGLEKSIIKNQLNKEFELIHSELKKSLRKLFTDVVKTKINLI